MKSKRIYKLLVAVFLAATCVFGMATPVLASPRKAMIKSRREARDRGGSLSIHTSYLRI